MKKIVAVSISSVVACFASFASAQDRPAPPEPRPAPSEVRPAPPEPRPAPPAEAGEREFGNPGVIAIGGDTTANFGFTQHSPPNGGTSTNNIDFSVAPNVQYFVAEGLSLGGTILFDWNKPNQGNATTTFGIGPTAGYNLWLTPGSLSLWPQVTFLFKTASETITSGTTSVSGSVTQMNLGAFVPLLIHPVKHFHFGVGPYFNVDLSNKASSNGVSADLPKDMNVGIAFEVAGWL